jgi:outer membrane protein TolC
LTRAVDAALEVQPLVRSTQLELDLAESRVTQARAERMPKLQATQTITRGNNPVFVFGSLLDQARFGPENFSLPALNHPNSVTNVRTALSVTVPVFDGMKSAAHVAEARIVRDRTSFQKTSAEQRTRFDVIRQYFSVLVAQENLKVSNDAVRTAEADLKRTQERIETGLAVESDRLAAQVQLAEFTKRQIEAEGSLATAVVALKVAIRSPLRAELNLTGTLARRSFSLPQQEELIERALMHRPDLLEAASGIRLAERRVGERRSDYLPEARVFGSFGSSGRNWTTGSTDYAVGASLTLNLLDPGRASRLQQARIEQSLAQTEQDRMRDRIIVEVARAYHQYRTAVQQLEVAEAALSQANEALRIIQDRYEAGLTTITDLLRAETAAVSARASLIAATEAQYIGYANVLLAIGELNDVQAFEL